MNTGDPNSARHAIARHPVYGMLRTPAALATFMEHHVYTVWARLTLIRALQRRVNGVELPWRPSTFPTRFVRAVNRLVTDAESDRFTPMHDLGHFELYLQAMGQVGADTTAVSRLVDNGDTPPSDVPKAAAPMVSFVDQTATRGMNEEVAATLLDGFVTLSGDVDAAIIQGIGHFGQDAHLLRMYASRRLQLDGARDIQQGLYELLRHMIRGEAVRDQWARDAAHRILELQATLWDGVASLIAHERDDVAGLGGGA